MQDVLFQVAVGYTNEIHTGPRQDTHAVSAAAHSMNSSLLVSGWGIVREGKSLRRLVMKPIKLKLSQEDTLILLREKYTCLARLKYGERPHISKATASTLCSTHGLPKLGHEMFVSDNRYGKLYVLNLSGQFFVEQYMSVSRTYDSIPNEWTEELNGAIREALE